VDAPGVTATDASIRRFDPAILRPETIEPPAVRRLPTASFSTVSTSERTGVGPNKNANGVKQQLLGVRFFGVGSVSLMRR
jgi:hypothetical protein